MQKMKSMKQTTLFSLKSWKTKPEDLLVYKKRLEKKNISESAILKTLALLTYFDRESIISSGTDENIKQLSVNANIIVAMEAKRLLVHWNLDVPQTKLEGNSLKVCDKKMDTDINQKKPPSNSCEFSKNEKTLSLKDTSSLPKPPLHETSKNEPSILFVVKNTNAEAKVKGVCFYESECDISKKSDLSEKENNNTGECQPSMDIMPLTNNEIKLMQDRKELKKMKTLSKSEIKAMKDRVETISKIFLETFGKQQVELYLEQHLD